MELTIKQLYSDYENKDIVRIVKSGELQGWERIHEGIPHSGIFRIVKSGELQEPRKEQSYDQE